MTMLFSVLAGLGVWIMSAGILTYNPPLVVAGAAWFTLCALVAWGRRPPRG